LTVTPAVAALSSVAAGTQLSEGSPGVAISTAASRGAFGLAGVAFAAAMSLNIVTCAAIGMLLGELVRALTCLTWRGVLRIEPGILANRTQSASHQFRTAVPHVAAMGTVNINPVISRGMASIAPVGGVVAIELSDKLLFAVVTVISSVLLVPATKDWTRLLANPLQSSSELHRSWDKQVRAGAVAGLAISAVSATALIWPGQVILDRLNLPDDRIWLCAVVLMVGLPANNVLVLGARFLALVGRTSALPVLAIVNLFVMTVSAILLFPFLGVVGIAAASTLMRCSAAYLYMKVVPRAIRHSQARQFPVSAVR
jgi:hypothetical protein